LIGLVLIVAGVTPALAAEDDPRWSLSTSVNYSVGDYGTNKDTTIVYVPFTFGVRPVDKLWISLTLPWIYQSSENVVVTAGGVAVRKKGGRGKFARPERSTSESGVGDLLLKVSYIVLEERDFVPEIAPYVRIKFPTADSDRGLGTGEFDETIGVDLSKRLIHGLFGYLSLSYTFIGSPPGSDLRNSFGWSLGPAYALGPVSVFGFLEGATVIAPGQGDPLDVRVGAEFGLLPALKLTGAVTRGLSKGSADWGVSAGLALRF